MNIDYKSLYVYKPYNPETTKAESYSLINEPIDISKDRLQGKSRYWGDADLETQKIIIDLIVAKGQAANLTSKEIFLVLAMVRVESGFNPDAATPLSSAGGIGQFINKTAETYGIKDLSKRFDAETAIQALIDHTLYNKNLAIKDGYVGDQIIEVIYGYHHGGLKPDEEGLKLSKEKIMPLIEKLERYDLIDPNKPVVVMSESKTGRNERFYDKLTGRTMDQIAFISRINAGDYPGYTVKTIHGEATPVSNPDSTPGNNLG